MIDQEKSAAKDGDTLPSMFHEGLTANMEVFLQMNKQSKIAVGESFLDGSAAVLSLLMRDYKADPELNIGEWIGRTIGPQYIKLMDTLQIAYLLIDAFDSANAKNEAQAPTDDGIDMLNKLVGEFNAGSTKSN